MQKALTINQNSVESKSLQELLTVPNINYEIPNAGNPIQGKLGKSSQFPHFRNIFRRLR